MAMGHGLKEKLKNWHCQVCMYILLCIRASSQKKLLTEHFFKILNMFVCNMVSRQEQESLQLPKLRNKVGKS